MKKLIILMVLLVLIEGCSFSKDLLDEKLLVQTLTQELDNRKKEAIEMFGAELDKLGQSLTAEIKKELLDSFMDRQELIVQNAINEQRTIIAQMSASIDQKHQAFLDRLPWYGIFLVLLIWGASIIDDVFRWVVGKPKKE